MITVQCVRIQNPARFLGPSHVAFGYSQARHFAPGALAPIKQNWFQEAPLAFSRPLLSAAHFCDHCQQETQFLPLHSAIVLAGVSRSTMYYWMERRWIHWRAEPSGRLPTSLASLNLPPRSPVSHLPE